MTAARKFGVHDAHTLPSILYVEDNVINSKVVKYGLRAHYDVTVAEDAASACVQIREHGSEFTAILMDIELQGSELDGVELTRLFRGNLDTSKLPEYAKGLPRVAVPIIIVTAFSERYANDFFVRAGADSLMGKPVNLPRLIELLHDIQH